MLLRQLRGAVGQQQQVHEHTDKQNQEKGSPALGALDHERAVEVPTRD